ncbi:ATP-grasp domain-containing protein [Streptomyces sp. NPDC001205]
MTEAQDVLIYSKRFAGGVRIVSRMLSDMGRRPVLVSDEPDDVNRDHCAAHVVIDWARADLDDFVAAIDAAGVIPTAIVNFVEPLISWQTRTARHYGLPGGEPGRETLLSKAAVRQAMAAEELSALPFTSGPAGSLGVETVTSYPVIVKPDKDSGGSRMVRRADSPAELRSRLDEIAGALGPDGHVIVEEYIDGTEFSVDGAVLQGRFVPLLSVEKTEHDEARHHDAGLRIAPPPSDLVRRGARQLTRTVGALCVALGLQGSWLHVEGRVREDGTCELIEINPRPGGGLYRIATQHTCGIDPIELSVRMALGEELDIGLLEKPAADHDLLVALLPFEADRVGTLVSATPLDELKLLPGVVDGYQFEGFRVTSMDQENFFTEVLITAESVAGLREIAQQVRGAFTFSFE